MKAEELIIGHFDKTLTQTQEAELQQLLTASPEARSLYERHDAIESMMVSDAATLAPSEKLDEVAIGAALGLLSEVSGSGAGFWLGGKIAAAITAVAVGGISIALITSSGSDHTSTVAPKKETPAARNLPSTPAPSVIDTPVTATPATSEKPAATVESTVEKSSVREAARMRASEKVASKKEAGQSSSAKQNPMRIDTTPAITVEGRPKIKPGSHKNK
jgi:hypothetical protein